MGGVFGVESMTCGLFSSFDPVLVGTEVQWKWLTWLMLLIITPVWGMYSVSTGWKLIGSRITRQLVSVFYQLLPSLVRSEAISILIVCFFILLSINALGLSPMGLSLTSHLCINLSLSFPIWISGLMGYFMNPYTKFFSHLLPQGSPLVLGPFLVIVELVSQIIRPFTLAVRLMANMMAGHLVISLIGEAGSTVIVSMSLPIVVLQWGFMLFEVAVCVVQAFVFVNLCVIYMAESA